MPRCIVIGVDGMDPKLAEDLMRQGRLPAFSKLNFSALATSNPAQSPVAWSCLATGTNPGGHGIFDFITRDPATHLPTLSILRPNQKNLFGSRSKQFLPVRRGRAFWQELSERGVPTRVIKWPISFPAEEISGPMLAGLGVPDISLTLGRYTLLAGGDIPEAEDRKGDVAKIRENKFELRGPGKSLLEGEVAVTPEKKSVSLRVGEKSCDVAVGEWSAWQELEFRPAVGQPKRGICRFYLVSCAPEILIYASSIHPSPAAPPFPVSNPDEYCQELAQKIGLFHTLGLSEETNGLADGCLSKEAFLSHANDIQSERERMLWHELDSLQDGLLAFVFDTSDRIQHIFWENEKEEVARHYERMDKVLEKVAGRLEKDDLLLVLSDHGFSSFQKSLHINSFLIEKGWLALKEGEEGEPLFKNVDWKKTKAYAAGFSGIFMNQKGREKHGILSEEEAKSLTKDLAEELRNWEPMESAYLAGEIYSGEHMAGAPDIVLGTKPGYRASWQTALGAAPQGLVEDNDKPWNADHIVDPQNVPGVIFSNFPINKELPHVIDVAPSILKHFDVPPPDKMEGESLL